MSNLVLGIRAGEMMIINGAPIRFRTKAQVELTEHCKFLFGKQIMLAENIDTPEKRVYFAVQQIYVGDQSKIEDYWNEFNLAVAAIQQNEDKYDETINLIVTELREENYYTALKFARKMVRHGDKLPVQEEKRPQGHNCNFSSNIADCITAGTGKLDGCGNFENPCQECVDWAERGVASRKANLKSE